MKLSYCRCPGCGTCDGASRAELLAQEKYEEKIKATKLRSLLWEAYDVLKHCGQSDYADKLVEEMKKL